MFVYDKKNKEYLTNELNLKCRKCTNRMCNAMLISIYRNSKQEKSVNTFCIDCFSAGINYQKYHNLIPFSKQLILARITDKIPKNNVILINIGTDPELDKGKSLWNECRITKQELEHGAVLKDNTVLAGRGSVCGASIGARVKDPQLNSGDDAHKFLLQHKKARAIK